MDTHGTMIHFRLDARTGVPPYRQLVDQVRQAVSLGLLQPGDQLPPVREVVRQITINPNTVHRAYRDLESQGIVEGRTGSGTFVLALPAPTTTPQRRSELHREFVTWLTDARAAGMDDEAIGALVGFAMRSENVGNIRATQ
jgi:GntR family transcriptional regulator